MMQRTLKRLIAAVLLGATLAFGTLAAGFVAQQPTTMQVACPGNGSGGGC
jgi:hypothetical protein